MSSTPQFNQEQLAAVRSGLWHQATGQFGSQPGDPLLTLESARAWLSQLGLVLFAPRAHQLPVPAPSLVEATLGRAATAPTAAETETARSLVARLTTEGAALPLNLLGGQNISGDTPDFIVSTQVFSYVFTLRGDKAWKQPPSTSGAAKVSPLALKVNEVLAQGRALTAAELVSELGRELNENAILRALHELWTQLRVIPLLQQDGSATLWELTARRFTKQIKAGANAGQPTALSALISLYLTQVYAALEEQIEIFLSPLAARSRVRDVLHGLTAARQLEPVVLEGKRLLYMPGALPEFPETAAEPEAAAETASPAEEAKPEERIRRFDRPRRTRERPRPSDEDRPVRPSREERPRASRGDRPARAFGGDRPARPSREDRPRVFGEEAKRPRKPFDPMRKPSGARKPFGKRREDGDRPRAERGDRPERGELKSFGDRERRPFQRDRSKPGRPSFTRPWNEDRKPRPRRDQGERPPRESRPRFEGERPRREGERPRPDRNARPSADRAAFRPRLDRNERPAREGRENRPPRPGGFNREDRPNRPFRPRPHDGEGTRPQKRFRRPDEDRGEARAPGARPAAKRTSGAKPFGKKPFGAKSSGGKSFGAKPFAKKPFGRPAFGKLRSEKSGQSRPPRGVNPRKANRKPNPPRETEE